MKNVSVTPGVIVERVGDDLMVIIPGNTDVVSLSGRVADILLDVKAGKTVDSNDPAVHDLITLGVLTAPGMSRRGLITAGAIGAGAGITMMAMPAAAASSSGPGDEDDDASGDDNNLVFFVNGQDDEKLLIRIDEPTNPPQTGIKATVSSDNPTVEYDLVFEGTKYNYYEFVFGPGVYPQYSVTFPGVNKPLDHFDPGTTITIFFTEGGVEYRATQVLVSG